MTERCKTIEPRLTAYLEKELPAAERLDVATHLRDCEGCRQALCQLEETLAFLKQAYDSYPLPEVDLDQAWKEIEAKVNFGPSRWEKFLELFKRPMIWGPSIAMAAVVLMFFVRLNVQDRQETTESVALVPVEKALPPEPEQPLNESTDGPVRVCQVESVYSRSGNVMLLQTAGSGQPLIWILPEKKKEGEES